MLVTATSFGTTDPSLRSRLEEAVEYVQYNPFGRPLSAAELSALIGPMDGIIAGLDEINRQVIENAPRLKVIARYGVGVDNVDLDAAREHGIIVTNTPGANASSVAELTIGLMLALLRQIPLADRETRQGRWPRLDGLTLEGKVVGLLGLGAIGKQVAQRLHGFSCQVVAYDPYPDTAFAAAHGVVLLQADEVLARADILSLHLPSGPMTRGLVNAAFIAKMKPGAFLINTARGDLVCEPALVAALETGRLRGAALDTLVNQPPRPDNPLLSMPQVIVTPHIGAHTDKAAAAMGYSALQSCLAVLRGEEPEHRVA